MIFRFVNPNFTQETYLTYNMIKVSVWIIRATPLNENRYNSGKFWFQKEIWVEDQEVTENANGSPTKATKLHDSPKAGGDENETFCCSRKLSLKKVFRNKNVQVLRALV